MSVDYLVLGGTGSLGQKLIERLLPASSMAVYSRDEAKQWTIRNELSCGRLASRSREALSFYVGDVRDAKRLRMVIRQLEPKAVIFAAALKQVDTCELAPFESVQTNLLGVNNAVDIVAEGVGGVEKLLLVSTDKSCLAGGSSVELASGDTISIRDYVIGKGTAPIKTLGSFGFSSGKVTGWLRNRVEGRGMLKMCLRNPQLTGALNEKGLWLTEDHKVLTPSGWREAGSLKNGDLVVTSTPAPNERQTALIVGALLGDASVGKLQPSKGSPNTYVHFGHSEQQLEWLSIKHAALSELTTGEPRLERPSNTTRSAFWIFRFKAARFIVDLYNTFYPAKTKKRKKCVPRDLVEKYFNPVMAATWYMDDGTFVKGKTPGSRPAARLETQGFCEGDVRWLATFLTNKGFPAYAYPHKVRLRSGEKKTYWQIRFTVEGAAALFRFVGRLVPPALRYKLPKDAPAYNSDAWDLGTCVPFVSPIEIKDRGNPPQDVYCLEVEGTHNFCANGFVVHNCSPVNTYGMSKAISERLVTSQARFGTQVKFVAVRYGNVLESRGSIIPLFRHQAANGEAFTVTDADMTRFVMTLDQSVDLIDYALTVGVSGETWIPRLPAMRVGDLAELFSERFGKPIKIVGLRAGEKMHEDLVNESESPRARKIEVRDASYSPRNYYAIGPAYAPGAGKRFTYASNHEVLSKQELEETLVRYGVLDMPLDGFKGARIEEIRTGRV